MQPPSQPQYEPQQYQTPPSSGGMKALDIIVGILTILGSLLFTCIGIGIAGIGGALGAAAQQAAQKGATGASDAAAAQTATGLFAGAGIIIALASVVNIAGGIGTIMSKRWGFILTAIMTGIIFVLSLLNEQKSAFAIGFTGLIVLYVILRAIGVLGGKSA